MKPSKSALFEAARRWDAKAVAALLKAAPELVQATDPKGRRALHIACAAKPGSGQGEANGIATVTALLKAGADLEAHVPMPEEEGDFRANDLLIAAGADPAIKDHRGRDAIDIAKARRLPKPVIERLAMLRRATHAL